MNKKIIGAVAVGLTLVLAACSSSTPTPEVIVVTPEGSAAPQADTVWDAILASGRMVFGTSADYEPFSYYDEDFEVDGFDVALAKALGAKLGLQVEVDDFAFDSLGQTVLLGQVQAAIAALGITPERQAVVDFTHVYYKGEDALLAHEGSGLAAISAPAQLAGLRVGVQLGSVYEDWVETNLVDTVLIPAQNLVTYPKPIDAVDALKANQLDVVMMDALPADEYVLEGGVVLAGGGLFPQSLAIAVPKGAPILLANLNQALIDLNNDGTLSMLAKEYLDLDIPEVMPPQPTPAPTATPGPTATPIGCHNGMSYVSDLSYDDENMTDPPEVQPGEQFDKGWRIRNSGTCNWDKAYHLTFVRGDKMNRSDVAIEGIVQPGQTYDIWMPMTAPNTSGVYQGFYQMETSYRSKFGETIWVGVEVVGQATPVPSNTPDQGQPTATQAPPTPTTEPPTAVPPTATPSVTIDFLTADPTQANQGDVVTISWSFSGQDLASARLTRSNPDGSITPLNPGGNPDAPPTGTYEDLAGPPGTYIYTLKVDQEFGGSAIQSVQVVVASS